MKKSQGRKRERERYVEFNCKKCAIVHWVTNELIAVTRVVK